MQIDANKFDTIARGPFAPMYTLLASQILARSAITSGVCLDLGSGGGYLGWPLPFAAACGSVCWMNQRI